MPNHQPPPSGPPPSGLATGVLTETLSVFKQCFPKLFWPSLIYAGVDFLAAALNHLVGAGMEASGTNNVAGSIIPLRSIQVSLIFLAGLLIYSSVSVRLIRIVLYGKQLSPTETRMTFGRRECRFIGYSLLWAVIFTVLTIVVSIVVLFPLFILEIILVIYSGGSLASGAWVDLMIGPKGIAIGAISVVILGGVSLWVFARMFLFTTTAAAGSTDGFMGNFVGGWDTMKGHALETMWIAALYVVVVVGPGMILGNVPLDPNSEAVVYTGMALQSAYMVVTLPLFLTWVAVAYRRYGAPVVPPKDLPSRGGSTLGKEDPVIIEATLEVNVGPFSSFTGSPQKGILRLNIGG